MVAGPRLEALKDIDARARVWHEYAGGFVAQARGVVSEPPIIDWDEQSHAAIRKALERFLDVRPDLERLALAN